MAVGGGANARLECEDRTNNATPARSTTMRKRTAIDLVMMIRDRPRKTDCLAIAYIL